MQIVIDIPKELYESYECRPPMLGDVGMDMIAQSIANGTLLPKGHGRLIDADKLPYEDIESIDGNTYMCVNAYDIEHASTIIEGSDSDADSD